jgi:hypothetical protein
MGHIRMRAQRDGRVKGKLGWWLAGQVATSSGWRLAGERITDERDREGNSEGLRAHLDVRLGLSDSPRAVGPNTPKRVCGDRADSNRRHGVPVLQL